MVTTNAIALFLSVSLGCNPELPAESCKEIKASEGEQAVSGKYWFDSIIPDKVVLAHYDMKIEGDTCYLIQFIRNYGPECCCYLFQLLFLVLVVAGFFILF